jgi:NAD(P)-dependent dehydrogenase (short-subunit alcohol dehydrogenase family)
MTDRLTDQIALVTGAGQGVGRGCALALSGEGARVALLGRTLEKCEAVAEEIRKRGGEALPVMCDVESREQVDAAVAQVVDHYGRLDAVVNNAQSLAYKLVRKLTEEDMQSMWESGPMGTFRMQQACFEQLRASKGCIVNMGSGSSILPRASMSGYAMAKEAIRILTRVTAVEWGRYGIRVNAVCPLADSPGMDFFSSANPGAYEEMVIPEVPLGRMGDAETDIGRAVVFLCSQDASYTTGTTLMVDGGYNFLR